MLARTLLPHPEGPFKRSIVFFKDSFSFLRVPNLRFSAFYAVLSGKITVSHALSQARASRFMYSSVINSM